MSSIFLTFNGQAQPLQLKLHGIRAGLTAQEYALPFDLLLNGFQRYMMPDQPFPALGNGWNGFSLNSHLYAQVLPYIDLVWKFHKTANLSRFLQHAIIHAGTWYTNHQVNGCYVTRDQVSMNGTQSAALYDAYSQSMHFKAAGLQVGWQQHWYPGRKNNRFAVFTGLSYRHGLTFNGIIKHQLLSVASEYNSTVQTNHTITQTTFNNLATRNFRLVQWQVPFGLQYQPLSKRTASVEFNLGLASNRVAGMRSRWQEVNGAGTRLMYQF